MSLDDLKTRVRQFARERDWEQFHGPKNLVMALTSEVGELSELFQWLTPQQSQAIMDEPDHAARVREEIADILIYLVRLADVLEIDLLEAAEDKLRVNAAKYPADRSRGRADKYTELGE
ncbi:MAG: nucleotide pyrophosphohydrolase [Acidobacteria bacterium]|nr:nucleotide pyrophosphohydrolase [Acidobacteriota bacterium]